MPSQVLAVDLGQQVLEGLWSPRHTISPEQEDLVMMGMDHTEYCYDKAMPLIFMGGMHRRGTMLDAHPKMCCGKEIKPPPAAMCWTCFRTGPSPARRSCSWTRQA